MTLDRCAGDNRSSRREMLPRCGVVGDPPPSGECFSDCAWPEAEPCPAPCLGWGRGPAEPFTSYDGRRASWRCPLARQRGFSTDIEKSRCHVQAHKGLDSTLTILGRCCWPMPTCEQVPEAGSTSTGVATCRQARPVRRSRELRAAMRNSRSRMIRCGSCSSTARWCPSR